MLDPAVSFVFVSVFIFVSGFCTRHVLFTESTCPLFRSPFSYAISIQNSRVPRFSVLSLLPLDTRLPALRLFDHSVSQIPACLCSQPLSCIQCIRICLMGMLGGFYVTSRASRCASTPAFWFSSCSLGLPLSSEMSVPSLKFIHVSASVQCPVVASSSSGSLAFDSRLRFHLGFSVGFPVSLGPPCFPVFSLVQSQSQFQSCLSAPRFRIQIPVHLCLSVIV